LKRRESGSSISDRKTRAFFCATAFILLWLAVLAACAPREARAEDAVRVSHGAFIISDAEDVPGDGAPWQTVTFPHRTAKPNRDDLLPYWYRASFESGAHAQPTWLFFPKLRSGGTIFVNGKEVRHIRSADALTQVRWFRPALVFVPAAALHRGHNEVAVRFAIREPLTSFGEFLVGPEPDLRDRFENLLFWEDTSTTVSNLICLIFGTFTLTFWLRRRQERLYGILAACALFWGVRTFVFRMPIVPMDFWVLWRFAYYFTTGGFIVCITLFLLRFSESAKRGLSRFLLAYWLLGCATFLLIGSPARLPMDGWWTMGFLPFTAYATVRLVAFALRRRTASSIALVFAILFALALALHDFGVQHNLLGLDEFYLLHLGIPAFLLVMASVLLDRFVRTLRESDITAEQLSARVAQREAELAKSYERMRALERAHATAEERQRIMQDMHDGVGSQLLSSLLMIERHEVSKSDIVALLQECLDDMRLVIDSLSPDEPDLLPVLGNLRFRMEPRMAKIGLVSTWSYRNLPDTLELAPHDALQILRILQEALANVFKHANAKQVWVNVGFEDGVLEVRVADDGAGYNPAGHSTGRGIANMRSRAVRIGAELSVAPESTGTVVLLRFRVRSVVPAAASDSAIVS
jgi:signal transduction histidine kinase